MAGGQWLAEAKRRGFGDDGIYFDHRADCRDSDPAQDPRRPPLHQFPLATFNVKDFEDFAEHDGLNLITP